MPNSEREHTWGKGMKHMKKEKAIGPYAIARSTDGKPFGIGLRVRVWRVCVWSRLRVELYLLKARLRSHRGQEKDNRS